MASPHCLYMSVLRRAVSLSFSPWCCPLLEVAAAIDNNLGKDLGKVYAHNSHENQRVTRKLGKAAKGH